MAGPRSSLVGSKATLPVQYTRFFGREEEIARLTDILSVPETRLVTLTGPGGSGKTRLAIAVAGRLQEEFGDAVWFVPLAEVRDGQRLGDAVREAMGLPPAPGAEPLEQVVAALQNQRCLLVLDNFEQLVEEGAPQVHSLLSRLPLLTCLVTSRQRLDLAAEREFIVLPLPTPRAPSARGSGVGRRVSGGTESPFPDTPHPTPDTLLQSPSVGLFVDRAQAARPGFRLTPQNVEAVVALCDRLEGLPLAIELAAARASVLTPEQTLARLSQRFDLLVSTQRDRSARHRSLWTAIEWSYQQLSPVLQRFFAGLSVFRGGFTLDAAEAVACHDGVGACRELQAVESIERLRKSTLIVAEEAPDAAEMRYRLLETLREYAAEQSTPEQQAAVARRHAEYFLGLAEQAEAAWRRGDLAGGLERLQPEQDNLRAALGWSLGSPFPSASAFDPGELGVRLAAATGWFWRYRGHLREGRQWLEQALGRADGAKSSRVRARLLLETGGLLLLQGDFNSARPYCEESLPLFQVEEDRVGMAEALCQLGWVAYHLSDLPRARAYWEESLALWRQVGHKAEMIELLRHLWRVVANLGDAPTALSLRGEELALMRQAGGPTATAARLVEAADRAEQQGDRATLRSIGAEGLAIGQAFRNNQEMADALTQLGLTALDLGEYGLARALLEQRLETDRALGRQLQIHRGLWSLARTARLAGELTAARTWVEESLHVAREIGSKEPIAHALDELRLIAWKQGDWQAARSLPQESLNLWQELGNPWGLAEALEGVALLAMALDQASQAARLLGAAERLRETIRCFHQPHERPEYARSVSEARAALGDAAFAALWAEGRALSPEQAVAEAQKP